MIKTLSRYIKIYVSFLRFDLIYDMTYRTNFMIMLAVEVFYTVAAVVFFQILYANIKSLVGWSYYEMMFLVGLDTVMGELLVALVFAYNTNNLPERINNGEIDYMLLKPIHSFFYLTFGMPYAASLIATLPGFYLMGRALNNLHRIVSPIQLISGMIILLSGFIIGYSIMVIISSLAFKFANSRTFPRIGMNTVISFSNLPHQVFKGSLLRSIFFFIIPSVFLVSVPASTFIREFNPLFLVQSIVLGTLFLFIAVNFWNYMIKSYTSASS